MPRPSHPCADVAPPQGTRRDAWAFAAWFAPAFALFWFVSTFFLLGDIGFWNDDYFMAERALLGEPGPVHILPAPTPFEAPSPATAFWRPLLTIGVTTLVSNSWDRPWIAHLIFALAHAGTALLLFALMRQLGRSRATAAWCCLLYLVWPSHYEASLWANGFLSGLSTGAVLASAMLYIAWARRAEHATRGTRLALLAGIAACGLVMVAANEQPAGALLGLPMLYLASRPDRFARQTSPSREFWHAALPILLLGVIVAGAIVLVLVAHAGAGGAGGFAPPELWPRRWVAMLDAGWRELLLRTQGVAAARLGIDTIRQYPARSIAAGACLLALIIALWRITARPRPRPPAHEPAPIGTSPLARRLAISAAGLLMFFGACVPLAVVDAHMRPRMTAILLAGALVALAGPTERIASSLLARRERLVRPALILASASVLTFGALSMVGTQRAFQLRWHHDRLLAQALRDRFHDLPPDSILMPLRGDDWPVHTGRNRFDAQFVGPFHWSFAFPSFSRIALREPRISASFVHPDTALAFAVTPTHLLRHGPMPWPNTLAEWPEPPDAILAITAAEWKPPRLPKTARWTPIDRCVPFVTRADGGIDPVTRLIFRQGATPIGPAMVGGTIVLEVDVPRTTALAASGRCQPLTWIIDIARTPRRTSRWKPR